VRIRRRKPCTRARRRLLGWKVRLLTATPLPQRPHTGGCGACSGWSVRSGSGLISAAIESPRDPATADRAGNDSWAGENGRGFGPGNGT
jgi:hypothetical protein